MKNILLSMLLLLTIGCNANPPKNDAVSAKNPNQHIAIAVTVASFYCDNNRWPTGINELQKYSKEEMSPLPVEINWGFITDPRTTFRVTKVVYLRIPGEVVEPGGITVSSTNKPPKCEDNNITTDFHMNIADKTS